MRAADFFCGAGGASLGLDQAGYHVAGYDVWTQAVETHNANGLLAYEHDLSDPRWDVALEPCDLAWFSCPCQPFSAAGDGDGEFDERDGFPWALRIIDRLLPPVVIFENVKGLTFAKHHAYFAGILASLRDLGYHVEWKVLNTADYGVPQTRERCFIVGRRDGGVVTWPTVTHTEQAGMFTQRWVTMADALGWGPDEVLDYCADRGVGMRERHGERDPYPATGPAPTMSSRPDTRWSRIRPATGVAGDTRVFQPGGHHQPGEQSENAIRLTIAELATLQGFPPDWIWTGTKTAQARQVGNAVPPVMARLLAEANRPIVAEPLEFAS